jgi:SWI/SNF-related matrix-associated actin-dependent regulator of chromatin subfamily A3
MLAKNRKFKVTGASFYKNDAEEGDLIFFELEPDNPHDKNAIKVLNEEGLMLGHIPKENAKEIKRFHQG